MVHYTKLEKVEEENQEGNFWEGVLIKSDDITWNRPTAFWYLALFLSILLSVVIGYKTYNLFMNASTKASANQKKTE